MFSTLSSNAARSSVIVAVPTATIMSEFAGSFANAFPETIFASASVPSSVFASPTIGFEPSDVRKVTVYRVAP
uniref:Uncharacterized protein n=1 Tax=uncultured marine virus TaxID=186617 RepID=A0A0F7L3W2_9VIRU|nr:hypothetical protein [uncultured marine virus]